MDYSLTDSIASFCAETNYSDLNESTRNKAKMAIVDTYGVIYTGFKEPVSDILIEWIKSKQSQKESTILGYKYKTSASNAALINGTMGHAIDFDDHNSLLRGHPSIPILPAILAVGERQLSSGQDLLTAFTLGTEVMVKLGKYINPAHYKVGWHSTATLGVMGAAVAVGKLLNFNKEKMKMVMALAASMASGMRLNFGTMIKPFHVGYAAKNGVEAAELIDLGLIGSEKIFDTDISFLNLYANKEVAVDYINDWGNPWEVDTPGFNVKRYPCCFATHRAADAVENIHENYHLTIDQIQEVFCFNPIGGTSPLIYSRPKTGLEGKFSMQYVIAAMLLDRKIDLNTFTSENVNRVTIQDLLPKIHSKESADIKENREAGDLGYTHIKIVLKHGKEIDEKVYYSRGSFKKPLDEQQLYEKFVNCLTQFEHMNINKIFNRLLSIEKIDSREGWEEILL